MKKLVSIVIPAYNEELCISELANRLQNVFQVESNYDFEVIFVENGSSDSSWDLLKDFASKDSRFKVLRLSRNFRMDGGLTAGLDFVKGDACVLMTADLQDPPEFIHDLLRKWESGYKNVYGIVTKRTGTKFIRRVNSKAFYFVANVLTDGKIPKNVSDFRLVDRSVYLSVRELKERNRFVRGLFSWIGYSSIGIPMVRAERFAGESKAHSLKVIDLAFKGIFAHSYKPLKLITLIGLGLSTLSTLAIFPLIFLWIFSGVPFAGFGTLVTLLLLLISFLFLTLGIIGEYVGLIYEEVKQRPNYVVSEKIGLQD
jgi:glycosyltransferase involved in cell wall biosynthesis